MPPADETNRRDTYVARVMSAELSLSRRSICPNYRHAISDSETLDPARRALFPVRRQLAVQTILNNNNNDVAARANVAEVNAVSRAHRPPAS